MASNSSQIIKRVSLWSVFSVEGPPDSYLPNQQHSQQNYTHRRKELSRSEQVVRRHSTSFPATAFEIPSCQVLPTWTDQIQNLPDPSQQKSKNNTTERTCSSHFLHISSCGLYSMSKSAHTMAFLLNIQLTSVCPANYVPRRCLRLGRTSPPSTQKRTHRVALALDPQRTLAHPSASS
jgi:hypothetical protein